MSDDAVSLERLVAEEAAADLARVRAEARERAARVGAAAETEAQGIREAARREGAIRGQARAAAVVSDADARYRLEVLQAREAQIETAIAQARERLAALRDDPHAGPIALALIREGLAVLPAGAVRIRLPAPWLALLSAEQRQALATHGYTLEWVPEETAGGGVVLETADGRLRCDHSFEARVRRCRDQLRRLAADALFGDERVAGTEAATPDAQRHGGASEKP